MHDSPAKELLHEFKGAVFALYCGITYGLVGLHPLARGRIDIHGRDTSTYDRVEAIDEDFSKLADDANWFQHYLEGKSATALEKDYSAFLRDNMFGCGTNVAADETQPQGCNGTYNSERLRIFGTEQELAHTASQGQLPVAHDPHVEEAPKGVSVAVRDE